MIRQIWRLSEGGDESLGVACTNKGLLLGRTPLIEWRHDRFSVRSRSDVEKLLSCAYGTEIAADRLMPGFAIVASALNADDMCLACIAAVQLRLPDLPDQTARDDMEALDALIKYPRDEGDGASWDAAKHPRVGTPPNSGWFAATGSSRDGSSPTRTAANDDPRQRSDATPSAESNPNTALIGELKNRITRHRLRISLVAALEIGVEGLGNLIPGVDVAADVALVAAVARTASEYRQLAVDAAVALDFVKRGPHSLEDLTVSSNYQEFSNYGAFVKGESSPNVIVKMFGLAGSGKQYHHIVTQGALNGKTFPAELLQNTGNIVPLPALLHEVVTDEYRRPAPDNSGRTLYRWLQTQPYEVQREMGLKILRELRILK
jgi:hypothetical protein